MLMQAGESRDKLSLVERLIWIKKGADLSGGDANFFLPGFTAKTPAESMIEVLIEGHFVLPVSKQAVCFLYEGAFAKQTLRNSGASF